MPALLVVMAGMLPATFTPAAEAHTLKADRALRGASKVARTECENTAECFYSQAGPTCRTVFKHSRTCPIHLVTGVPGTQSSQWDCHRDLKVFVKKDFGLKLFFQFLSTITCRPNIEHPGLSGAV